jgi:hypothetical protein
MKKVALLIAAALVVSAPLVAASTTDTYAAAKKPTRTAKPPKDTPKADPNQAFGRALGDLFASLGKPWPKADTKAKKTKRG